MLLPQHLDDLSVARPCRVLQHSLLQTHSLRCNAVRHIGTHHSTVRKQYTVVMKQSRRHSCRNSLRTHIKMPHSHTPNAPGDNRTCGTCVDERELSVVWPRVHGLLRHLRIVQHGALGYSVMLPQGLTDVARLPTTRPTQFSRCVWHCDHCTRLCPTGRSGHHPTCARARKSVVGA